MANGDAYFELPLRELGQLVVAPLVLADLGATPASAGTTRTSLRYSACSASYPRERGDDGVELAAWAGTRELPPRARGRRAGAGLRVADVGATPASAGTTSQRRIGTTCHVSYPRERGDDVIAAPGFGTWWELPPRARGRRRPWPTRRRQFGATPASAGTTNPDRGALPRTTSYPRERGDDDDELHEIAQRWELPPRARGRPGDPGAPLGPAGATPASAGTTPSRRRGRGRSGSYPRERGDDKPVSSGPHFSAELPPRARGRRHRAGRRALQHGATPASAGTTCA